MAVSLADYGLRSKPTEMQRVLALPRSVLTVDNVGDDIVDYWTERTRLPGSDWRLRPEQALALHNLFWNRGLAGAIGVGRGKSLISLLAHHALPEISPEKIMLLLPAANRITIVKEMMKFSPHFKVNGRLVITSYEELQQPNKGPTLFDDWSPDFIMCDEAHNLSEPKAKSARTNRVLLYAEKRPEVRFGVMSGTLFRKTLRSCAHLIELALRDASPLPRSWGGLSNLSACCDVPEGAPTASPWQWKDTERLVRAFHPDAQNLPPIMQMPVMRRLKVCREALYERTRTTPGVVQTSKDELGVSLRLQPLTPRVPEVIRQMILDVEETWMLPTGEELETPLDMHRVKQQLSMGFYYRWIWPNDQPDIPWLRARNAFVRATRLVVDKWRFQGIDTPALAARHYAALTRRPFRTSEEYKAADNELSQGLWLEYASAAWAWKAQEHKPQPPTEPVWVHDWFIEHVIARAEGCTVKENATVWYSHKAVADRLEELGAPITVYRAGEDPPAAERALPVALSIRSHGTGHNLQGWGRGIVLCPPSSAETWEQLIGRLLRPGQERDEVNFEVYAHTPVFANAIITAKRGAEFAEQTSGQPQKILYGDWIESDNG